MASLTFTGLEQWEDKLLALAKDSAKVASAALYDGAGVVADAMRAAIEGLPTSGGEPKPYHGLTADDKEDMLGGLGISKFDHGHDEVTCAISVNGYTRRTEKGYPNGVPLVMLARSLESGSSVRAKHPFLRPAINAARAEALAAMQAKVDEQIKKIMG